MFKDYKFGKKIKNIFYTLRRTPKIFLCDEFKWIWKTMVMKERWNNNKWAMYILRKFVEKCMNDLLIGGEKNMNNQ